MKLQNISVLNQALSKHFVSLYQVATPFEFACDEDIAIISICLIILGSREDSESLSSSMTLLYPLSLLIFLLSKGSASKFSPTFLSKVQNSQLLVFVLKIRQKIKNQHIMRVGGASEAIQASDDDK